MAKALTKGWERLKGLVGHQPLFEIDCAHCETPMFLRYSRLYLQRTALSHEGCINRMGYKCENCGYIKVFEVVDEEDYLMKLNKRRKGSTFYVPDMKEWADESEIRKKRLEALGYV